MTHNQIGLLKTPWFSFPPWVNRKGLPLSQCPFDNNSPASLQSKLPYKITVKRRCTTIVRCLNLFIRFTGASFTVLDKLNLVGVKTWSYGTPRPNVFRSEERRIDKFL